METLQQKPLRTRITILVVAVFIAMGIIIGIWILQLKYELEDSKTNKAPSLFQSIWSPIRDTLKRSP